MHKMQIVNHRTYVFFVCVMLLLFPAPKPKFICIHTWIYVNLNGRCDVCGLSPNSTSGWFRLMYEYSRCGWHSGTAQCASGAYPLAMRCDLCKIYRCARRLIPFLIKLWRRMHICRAISRGHTNHGRTLGDILHTYLCVFHTIQLVIYVVRVYMWHMSVRKLLKSTRLYAFSLIFLSRLIENRLYIRYSLITHTRSLHPFVHIIDLRSVAKTASLIPCSSSIDHWTRMRPTGRHCGFLNNLRDLQFPVNRFWKHQQVCWPMQCNAVARQPYQQCGQLDMHALITTHTWAVYTTLTILLMLRSTINVILYVLSIGAHSPAGIATATSRNCVWVCVLSANVALMRTHRVYTKLNGDGMAAHSPRILIGALKFGHMPRAMYMCA